MPLLPFIIPPLIGAPVAKPLPPPCDPKNYPGSSFVGPPAPPPPCDPGTPDVFTMCQNPSLSDSTDVYCCPFGDTQFTTPVGDTIFISGGGCNDFSLPISNDEGVPMLKSALNGTTNAAWVRIGFEQYCGQGDNPPADGTQTNYTVITVGNNSLLNDNICTAVIKSFQYGWGTVNSGNRCVVTIIDEQGSSFEDWVQRLVTNPESASKPTIGVYRMKVQFGWYVTGGAETDICGQPSAEPNTTPATGQNSAYTICSPILWFIPDMISVRWDKGKFIYELEGVDLLYRGQQSRLAKRLGTDGTDPFLSKMYFTDAVTKVGQMATPPFRVRFLALDQDGDITSCRFAKRPGNADDDECLGPYTQWNPYELTPIEAIQKWITNEPGVWSLDQTSNNTPPTELGLTINYDSTQDVRAKNNILPIVPKPDWYDYPCETCIQGRTHTLACQPNLPNVGTMIIWTGNGIPNCQASYSDSEINTRMKAVYIVNGGNCSPVISFNPVIKWHFLMGLKAGGNMGTTSGVATKQLVGSSDTNCNITGGRGGWFSRIVQTTINMLQQLFPNTQPQKASFLNQAANVMFNAIEAELKVQGDPSYWLCTPVAGYGRCVGIVFINPYYITDDGPGDTNCPAFRLNNDAICNSVLTNKGWFIRGVDHQISDGSYTTTIKVALPAPGAELAYAGDGALSNLGKLGAWVGGLLVSWGCTYASKNQYPQGSEAAGCTAVPNPMTGNCPAEFVGGGGLCDNGQPCQMGQTCSDGSSCDSFGSSAGNTEVGGTGGDNGIGTA
jgi:hypothetical protein